ncbi:aminoglycoside 6'-N-acetyltransferase I [Paenibacillus amylolyticus]|uniref:Aminoglycoside N(6')-acetyltransferase type 1 n=1 Tax=Paenibacillus amylolyticus TaxID=1451 RepID=A0AAP5H9E3_PAEAM|nr:aminoglycoside 6'-N-acetyltransferase [Paenibacillus amylolyticus]MDR6726346.1 aminoglycoside 6'-N-acetyltransferase I [Paenibacillus amylolyticus]
MEIVHADETTLDELTQLALKLWPENSWQHLRADFEDVLQSEKDRLYLAKSQQSYVGFIHLSIRTDYVEGSNSSPVGYVEGIYVEQECRNQGISKRLVEAGEKWAKSVGCTQIASDTELTNHSSQAFHAKIGFTEANRIVAFIKDLK